MDSNTIIAFAAIGGFLLGILNICITINKEYLRKPKLVVDLEKVSFVHRDEGIVDYQININFSSQHGDSYLKEIMLISDKMIEFQKDTYGSHSSRNQKIAGHIGYFENDLTTLSGEEFDTIIKPYYENNNFVDIRNLVIRKDLGESFTFAGRLAGCYYSDHSRFDIKTTGWKLRIAHGSGVEDIYLDEEYMKEKLQSFI